MAYSGYSLGGAGGWQDEPRAALGERAARHGANTRADVPLHVRAGLACRCQLFAYSVLSCAHRVESRCSDMSGHSLPTRAASGLVASAMSCAAAFARPLGPLPLPSLALCMLHAVSWTHVFVRSPQGHGRADRSDCRGTAAVATDRIHTRPPAPRPVGPADSALLQ
jgi:hypothetical protein